MDTINTVFVIPRLLDLIHCPFCLWDMSDNFIDNFQYPRVKHTCGTYFLTENVINLLTAKFYSFGHYGNQMSTESF